MRRVASTVTVVTIAVDDQPMGMTATAVSSLSAAPPSLLVCVNQSASIHNFIAGAKQFCVNVLHADQHDLARDFSSSSLRETRFSHGKWCREDGGPPYLVDAQASLTCSLTQTIAFATHSICIGTVEQVRTRDLIDPMVYLDGRFGHAAV